jgi:hypothetical protein
MWSRFDWISPTLCTWFRFARITWTPEQDRFSLGIRPLPPPPEWIPLPKDQEPAVDADVVEIVVFENLDIKISASVMTVDCGSGAGRRTRVTGPCGLGERHWPPDHRCWTII